MESIVELDMLALPSLETRYRDVRGMPYNIFAVESHNTVYDDDFVVYTKSDGKSCGVVKQIECFERSGGYNGYRMKDGVWAYNREVRLIIASSTNTGLDSSIPLLERNFAMKYSECHNKNETIKRISVVKNPMSGLTYKTYQVNQTDNTLVIVGYDLYVGWYGH